MKKKTIVKFELSERDIKEIIAKHIEEKAKIQIPLKYVTLQNTTEITASVEVEVVEVEPGVNLIVSVPDDKKTGILPSWKK